MKALIISLSIFLLVSCKGLNEEGSGTANSLGNESESNQTSGTQTEIHTGETGEIKPNLGSGGKDGGLIARFKPALVVRASGCIMCHANVNSNIITDFGYGNDYFFGAENVSPITRFSGAIYGNHAENWSSAKVRGEIFVPEAEVAYDAVETTLADYLRSQVTAPDLVTAAPNVIEKKSVYIGAPTEAKLLELAGTFPSEHPKWKLVGNIIGSGISGLRLAAGGQYVENIPGSELGCSGDVVINSVLFLNNANLRTNNIGCRLYVTKSVFIQGEITYLGDAGDRNLQISSARAIVAGMGPNAIDRSPSYNSIVMRLQQFWTQYGYFTRDTSNSTQEKLDAIVLDSSYISDLTDATSQAPNGRNVSFSRLLLNAPNFQSRYQGDFKGVIIAEMAIASLGVFAFEFDSVFERVPVLPLLQQSEFLSILDE